MTDYMIYDDYLALADAMPNIKGAVFDNDGVTYPYTDEIHADCRKAAAAAASSLIVGLSYDEAFELCGDTHKIYGSSYDIFTQKYAVDYEELHLAYHRLLNTDIIPVCAATPALLSQFKLPRVLLTHGSFECASKILKHLGIKKHFPKELIFALEHEDIRFNKKSDSPIPFQHVLRRLGIPANDAIMVEDSHRNLSIPKKIGMATVLITHGQQFDREQYSHIDFFINDFPRVLAAANGIEPEDLPEIRWRSRTTFPTAALN